MKLPLLLFLVLNIFAEITFCQNFSKLSQAKDSTNGYTDNNPLKMKKGDPVGGVSNSKKFLKGLRTSDGQYLMIIKRTGIPDPNYIEPPGGLLKNLGDGGILDKYELETSVTKEIIILYIDIYHKDKLFIPMGLK